MVPYVRKSFYKHFKDGLKYLGPEHMHSKSIEEYLNKCNDSMSIEDEIYKAGGPVYKYALDMTERECHQAVEGMYHNLNTLQSRSGNQLERVAA